MITKVSKEESRRKRAARVRKKVSGSAERPRLAIRRSLRHVYAQVIDDVEGHTIVAASSLEKEVRPQVEGLCLVEVARKVGEIVGKRALEKGVEAVVFDRAGYKYHGKVAALADGARSSGLLL